MTTVAGPECRVNEFFKSEGRRQPVRGISPGGSVVVSSPRSELETLRHASPNFFRGIRTSYGILGSSPSYCGLAAPPRTGLAEREPLFAAEPNLRA